MKICTLITTLRVIKMGRIKEFLFRIILLLSVELYFVRQMLRYNLEDLTVNATDNWKNKAFVIFAILACLCLIIIEIKNYIESRKNH